MTEHEKYQEHIRHTHDAFCKTVIRHAAIDAARSIRSRRKREISLEYLIEEKHYPFSTTDKYFAEQSSMTSYPLFVCGQMVLLESPELAAALSALSQMEQEIIFLYYFQRLTHREIGRRYGRAGNTTGRRIQMILRRLRAELEGLSYEPATSLLLFLRPFSKIFGKPHRRIVVGSRQGKQKNFRCVCQTATLFTVVVVNSGQNTPPQSLYW